MYNTDRISAVLGLASMVGEALSGGTWKEGLRGFGVQKNELQYNIRAAKDHFKVVTFAPRLTWTWYNRNRKHDVKGV